MAEELQFTNEQMSAIRRANEAMLRERSVAELTQQGIDVNDLEAQLNQNPGWFEGGISNLIDNIATGTKNTWDWITKPGERTEFQDIPELSESRLYRAGQEEPISEEGFINAGEPSRFSGSQMGAYTAGKLLTENDYQLAHVLHNAIGGDEGVGFWQDYYGNTVVNIDGEDFYLDKPGFSMVDVERLAGQLLAYSIGSKLWTKGNIIKRTLLAGLTTGTVATGRDISQWGLGGPPPEMDRSMLIAALGALGVPVVGAVGFTLKSAWNKARPWFMQGGNLSEEAIKALQKAGLDPSTMEPKLRRWFLENEQKYGAEFAATTTAQKSLPDELVVPLTAGEASSSIPTQQVETLLETGGLSKAPGDIAQRVRLAQSGKLYETPPHLLSLTGTRTSPLPGQALEKTQADLRWFRNRDAETYQNYYAGADATVARIPPADASTLRDLVSNISPAGSFESTSLYGKAMVMLDNQLAKVGTYEGSPAGATVGDLFQWRREVSTMSYHAKAAGDNASWAAGRAMIGKFEQYIDDLLKRGEALGDPMNIVFYKKALEARARFGKTWQATNRNDPNYLPGRIVNDTNELIVTPEEASNILLNNFEGTWMTRTGLNKGLIEIKRRLGEGSQGWLAIKDEVMLRMIARATKSEGVKEVFKPRLMIRDWSKLKRNYPGLVTTLFNVEEQALLNRFLFQAAKAGYKEPIPGAAGSNIGGVFMRMFGRHLSRLSQGVYGSGLSRRLFEKGKPPNRLGKTPAFSIAGGVVPTAEQVQEQYPESGWGALWPFQGVGQPKMGERGKESGLQ
tara:strand:- start:2175 stop:4553 length:2379 start_codon:yes stop_codon:yes gene_type:complete